MNYTLSHIILFNIERANSSLFGPLKIDFLHFVTPKQKNYVDSLTQTYREASQLYSVFPP